MFKPSQDLTQHHMQVSQQLHTKQTLLPFITLLMESFIFFIGILATCLFPFICFSNKDICEDSEREKSTKEFEGIPYIIGLLTSSLWTYYGIRKPGALLVATVNATGVVLEFIYVILFITFAPPSKKIKILLMAFIFDVLLFGVVGLVTSLIINGDEGISVIGLISGVFGMLLYASPLTSMIPNGMGFILGSIQLYMIYINPKFAKHGGQAQDKSQYDCLINKA